MTFSPDRAIECLRAVQNNRGGFAAKLFIMRGIVVQYLNCFGRQKLSIKVLGRLHKIWLEVKFVQSSVTLSAIIA